MSTCCSLDESEVEMPYAVVEEKVAKLSPQYRGELLACIDFLIFRQNSSVPGNGVIKPNASLLRRRRAAGRTLGGYEDGFYMAPDFDEPLECFKEYM